MKKVICFGEVLWDMLPSGKLAGGAPMNVAIHLKNLGVDSQMVSCVGKDDLGDELKDFIRKKGIKPHLIQVNDIHPTGIVEVDLSNPTDVQYQIAAPSAWDFIEASDILIEASSKADVFVFGSLVARAAGSKKTLLSLLDKANYRVFDVNLRKPFFDRDTLELLMGKADMIKLNDDEIKIIANWYLKSNDLLTQMSFLKSKYSFDRLCVTRGANGAILMDNNGVYEQGGFAVKVLDTIGSGDSFLANLLKNLLQGKTPSIALQNACAMGALVATHHGATPSIQEEDVQRFIKYI